MRLGASPGMIELANRLAEVERGHKLVWEHKEVGYSIGVCEVCGAKAFADSRTESRPRGNAVGWTCVPPRGSRRHQ